MNRFFVRKPATLLRRRRNAHDLLRRRWPQARLHGALEGQDSQLVWFGLAPMAIAVAAGFWMAFRG
jgi:hypothetical protein